MKKIGILTQYYNSKNIGGLLQAYALVFFLNKNNFVAEQLAFDFNFFDSKAHKNSLALRWERFSFKKLLLKPYNIIKFFLRRYQQKNIQKYIFCQNDLCAEFETFILHSPNLYNNANIAEANKEYDIFITGSDQVFSLYLLPLSAFWGEFAAPDKKVISYAASAGRNSFPPAAEKLFIKKLQRLNAIGVREKTLKEYIERITKQKAEVVLDPTLLLSPQEWLKIANQKVVPQKPYVFCYFLGDKCAWQRKKAQEYADKYGYEIVHLPYIMQNLRSSDRLLKGQGLYNVGPREFVSLIKEAGCIFTDSFHGMAFAINFGKNFYVFNRDDKDGPESMNARVIDTLAMFGLEKRHITDKNTVLDNTPIDFTNAHKILEQEKQKSINWLLNALKE